MRIDENYLKSQIRAIQDWPKDGITFRDITSVFENPRVSRMVIDSFIHRYINQNISHIAALDARGFLLGSTLAYALHKPLILFRKKGKLPPDTLAQDYQLEYGTATLEVKTDSFSQGDRVLLIDDLIATGGTLLAADALIRQSGATTIEAAAIIDLPDLGGSTKLQEAGIPTFPLCSFSGE
ncbi:adenine phosphoribosyltransferase [Endozoicomonas sp. Mp262]|uniref:adenine phosphoribosyltransferase n=1 Tax=Endozoicomonas sp. Mp262 TaxID=2919499 RepID=UPI0021DA8F1F